MSVDLSGAGGPPADPNNVQTFTMDPNFANRAAAPAAAPAAQQSAPINVSSNPAINSAANMAKSTLEGGISEIRNFVEQNPSSVRAFLFMAALSQGIYCGLGIFNIFSLTFSPTDYLINAYICLFAVTTLALEGKPEWPMVASIQERIFFQAHFLSTTGGRAFFYCFQGTFGMARYEQDLLMFLFGLCFFVVGFLILLREWRARKRNAVAVGGAGAQGVAQGTEGFLDGQYKV